MITHDVAQERSLNGAVVVIIVATRKHSRIIILLYSSIQVIPMYCVQT